MSPPYYEARFLLCSSPSPRFARQAAGCCGRCTGAIIGSLLNQLKEIDLNSNKTLLRHGSRVSPPMEESARARPTNLPVARGRRSLARTCV